MSWDGMGNGSFGPVKFGWFLAEIIHWVIETWDCSRVFNSLVRTEGEHIRHLHESQKIDWPSRSFLSNFDFWLEMGFSFKSIHFLNGSRWANFDWKSTFWSILRLIGIHDGQTSQCTDHWSSSCEPRQDQYRELNYITRYEGMSVTVYQASHLVNNGGLGREGEKSLSVKLLNGRVNKCLARIIGPPGHVVSFKLIFLIYL
jgi:hypothetical protein